MLVEEQQIQNSSCQFSVTKYAVPEKVVIAAIIMMETISTETNVQPTYNDVEYCTSKRKT